MCAITKPGRAGTIRLVWIVSNVPGIFWQSASQVPYSAITYPPAELPIQNRGPAACLPFPQMRLDCVMRGNHNSSYPPSAPSLSKGRFFIRRLRRQVGFSELGTSMGPKYKNGRPMNLAATFPIPDVPIPERYKVSKTAEKSSLQRIQLF